MALTSIDGVALSGLSAINGQTKSGLSAINGQVIGGATSGNVSWNNVSNFNVSSPPDITQNAGYNAAATSDQAILPTATSYFQYQCPTGQAATGFFYTRAYLMLQSAAPLTGGAVPNDNAFYLSNDTSTLVTVYKRTGSSNVYQTDFTYVEADTFRIGFDASNHFQVWKNGSVVWTDSATQSTVNFVMYVWTQNDAGTPGLKGVTYQQ